MHEDPGVIRHSRKAPLTFYGGMGLVFAAAAVIGFAPNSLAILSGAKPNPPLLIHAHAAAMSAWVLLLAAQALLIGQGKYRAHAALGAAAFFLAPIVFLLMLTIAFEDLKAILTEPFVFLIQLKRLLVFGGAVTLGLVLKAKHPEAHKRLMFLGTYAVLDAAFFRMQWLLPSFGVENWVAMAHIWQYTLLAAFVLNDISQTGRVHTVFIVGVPLIVIMQSAAAMVA